MVAASLLPLNSEYVDGCRFLTKVPPVGLMVLLAVPGAGTLFAASMIRAQSVTRPVSPTDPRSTSPRVNINICIASAST